MQCDLVIFTTLCSSYQIQLHFLPSQNCVLLSMKEINLCCPNSLRCVVFPWSVVDLPRTIVLEKNDLASPSS